MYNKENKEELSMSRTQRKYDHEYKVQAVKLAREIGGAKAAKELGIPEGTIHTWLKAVRAGTLDIDIVNIGWHIYLKDITAYAACSRDW